MFNIKAYLFRDANNLDLRLVIKARDFDELIRYLNSCHFDYYDRVIVEPILESNGE